MQQCETEILAESICGTTAVFDHVHFRCLDGGVKSLWWLDISER